MKYIRNFRCFLLIITLVSSLISCEKEEEISSKLKKLDGKGYFPMQIGNYWKFNDNMEIKINGMAEINGKEYFEFVSGSDTTYYRKSDDNIIYSLSENNKELIQFKLNAELNERWTSQVTSQDSSYTQLKTNVDTIAINEHNFYNCYRYFNNSYSQFIIDDESISWLAPNIGLIQIEGNAGILKLKEVQIDGIKIQF